MQKILFLTLLIISPIFAELEIVDSIPLDDLSEIKVDAAPVVIESAPKESQEWVGELSGIHNSITTKKSYLKGILNGQQYGQYTLEELSSSALVKRWYQKRGYETFWITSSFDINPMLFEMVEMIKDANDEGLNPEDYHLSEISSILDEIKNEPELSTRDRNLAIAQVDALLTDAFLSMARDLREGRIAYKAFANILKRKSQEEEIHYAWEDPKRGLNYLSLLKEVADEGSVKKILEGLVTSNELYIQLLQAYKLYKSIENEGGWKSIPRGKKLRMGNISKKRVPLLAKRLYLTGDLAFYDPEITVVTPEMKEALKHYQRRMGLWPSGVLTDVTRNALNVSVKKRVAKIKLNLERMRWEDGEFGDAYIFVNIPDFKMQFMQDGQKAIEMRVVVGKKDHPTPIFSSIFSYIVLNPTWAVPRSIVKKEMLPRIQEDPDYLASRKFKLYKGWDKNRKEIDGFDIDWWQYDEDSNLPYSFVREPGKGNPLGLVKFMFPNRYAVYMHDTPQKKLFQNSKRAYSHGCIRLHKPQELLEYVSDHYTSTPYTQVKKMQKTGKSQSLKLDYGIPVYIRYYTAWADAEGGVHFRNDIYGYDKITKKLLKK